MFSDSSQGATGEDLLETHLQELGRMLSSAREARGQSIEDLAMRLRMGVEQLRALESGDRARLPEMVFVIAQARRVASSLDLCLDEPIDALRQAGFSTIPSLPLQASEAGAPEDSSEPSDPSLAFPSPSAANDSAAGFDAGEKGTAVIPQPAFASIAFPRWIRPLATVALLAGVTAGGLALWRHGPPGQAQRSPLTTSGSGGTPRTIPSVVSVQLSVRTNKTSWLEVRTIDGKNLYYGLFKSEHTFPNQGGLKVRAGRPDLIIVQTGRGASRPLGTVYDLSWMVIHPDGTITPLPTPPNPS